MTMTILARLKRNKEIAKYLSTPITYSTKGRPVYPTSEEASDIFQLSLSQIFVIKKQYVIDDGIERRLKDD